MSPYSDYQQFLFQMIIKFRSDGQTFNEIASWLNRHGYQTPRGKKFIGTHAFSIQKKKIIRDNRINRVYEPELLNFDLQFAEILT